jgi:hypothetical protein
MLKKVPFHPPSPGGAETRPFPTFVLVSSKSSTYRGTEPILVGSGLGG